MCESTHYLSFQCGRALKVSKSATESEQTRWQSSTQSLLRTHRWAKIELGRTRRSRPRLTSLFVLYVFLDLAVEGCSPKLR